MKNKFIILGVANIWTKRKGIDYFCQLSKVLDESYKIVLVGVDKETSTKLPKNILSISRTSDAIELAQIYTAADVYVNPTLEDNYPTTNLEAISCGTPIITFDSGGSSECIKNSNFGISVKKADFNELVNSIKKARRNSESMCINEKNFNKADKYMEYKKIYTINMSRGR